MDPLQERFPDLYFDVKEVQQRTPKASPPSFAQVAAKILATHGIQNPGVASDIGAAAEAYYKGA